MPDTLAPRLTEAERKATADRLWKVMAMVDRRAPYTDLKEALLLTVREIEPFGAEYSKEKAA